MKEIKNTNVKKVAMAGAVALGLIAGGFAGAYMFPNTVTEYLDGEIVIEYLPGEIVYENVTVIEEVEVEKIVEVDNENLQLVLDTIYEKDGDVEYLIDGLYDDEVDQIVERIMLVNEVETLAKEYTLRNFATELEKNDSSYDRRDVSRIKIDNEDLKIVNYDFKYEDFTVEILVEFRYDGAKETKLVEVEYFNGRVRNLKFV